MIDAALDLVLAIIVLSAVAISLVVTVGAIIGWLRQQWRKEGP